METLSKEVTLIKDKLRANWKKNALSDDQVEIKLAALDSEFCTHAFVNDSASKFKTTEERLKFYIEFLKRQL